MQAGKLRHPVVIQSLVTGRDAAGGVTKTWSDFASVWADVRFLNGMETVRADSPVPMVRASIRIRDLAGVTADMRVVHDGKNFDIKAVLPDPTGARWLDLVCEQGLVNG